MCVGLWEAVSMVVVVMEGVRYCGNYNGGCWVAPKTTIKGMKWWKVSDGSSDD
ncbi:hypothetical protein SESBI_01423 [Sesbania bispinosa]|nr:hypothetical protein SESBI_01423 [Sesbania bispinosa]